MRNGKHYEIYGVRASAAPTSKCWVGVGLFGLLLAGSMVAPAQDRPATVTFQIITNFGGSLGVFPSSPLVQATDGDLYGTTSFGSTGQLGNVYKITPTGSPTVVAGFTCPPFTCFDQIPNWIVEATDGNFYGTTTQGGPAGVGSVFKLTPSGTLTTLYNFCALANCPDGSHPNGLIQAADGSLYGTTNTGGNSTGTCASSGGCGTLFKITLQGAFSTLYTFCSQANCADGANPGSNLIQASDGNFYGAAGGGAYGGGVVFKITPKGLPSTLYSFCAQTNCPDGSGPGNLLQATNGSLYGTTGGGGAYAHGTVFQLSRTGALSTLHSFCAQANCTDGANPSAVLQGSDGNFYGETYAGGPTGGYCGAGGCGMIFKITPGGKFTNVFGFGQHLGSIFTGYNPCCGLLQDTDGTFYGINGAYPNSDEIFTLSVGLGPFVKLLHTTGKVGGTVGILGTDLTGATGVSFNGTAAAFTVVSSTLITATVPAGASTGFVTVTTPTGTLKSNVKFQVF